MKTITNKHGTFRFADKDCQILHHVNRPAIEWADGTKEWYKNGKPINGAAIEYSDGSKAWYYNGKLCIDEQEYNIIKQYNEDYV